MHLARERIVNLVVGERDGFKPKRRDRCRSRSWQRIEKAQRHQRKRDLAARIYIEKPVHRVIDKTTNHFGGQALRRGDSQQVGQQRADIPPKCR